MTLARERKQNLWRFLFCAGLMVFMGILAVPANSWADEESAAEFFRKDRERLKELRRQVKANANVILTVQSLDRSPKPPPRSANPPATSVTAGSYLNPQAKVNRSLRIDPNESGRDWVRVEKANGVGYVRREELRPLRLRSDFIVRTEAGMGQGHRLGLVGDAQRSEDIVLTGREQKSENNGKTGQWAEVVYKGKKGWIHKNALIDGLPGHQQNASVPLPPPRPQDVGGTRAKPAAPVAAAPAVAPSERPARATRSTTSVAPQAELAPAEPAPAAAVAPAVASVARRENLTPEDKQPRAPKKETAAAKPKEAEPACRTGKAAVDSDPRFSRVLRGINLFTSWDGGWKTWGSKVHIMPDGTGVFENNWDKTKTQFLVSLCLDDNQVPYVMIKGKKQYKQYFDNPELTSIQLTHSDGKQYQFQRAVR